MNKNKYELLDKIDSLRCRLLSTPNNIKSEAPRFASNTTGKSTIDLIGRDSTCEHYGRLLHNLIKKYKPKKCLEMGTCLGISAAYIKAAQESYDRGCLISLEGIDKRAHLAKNNLEKLGFDNFGIIIGQFKDTLPSALKAHGKFDFVFIDGHHKLKPTLDYFKIILPHLNSNALVIIDDLDLSDEMQEAWLKIINISKVSNHQRLDKWGLLSIK